MPWLHDLPDALSGWGLNVVEVPGWRTRGHGPMRAVRGIIAHHTATSASAKGDLPTLNVLKNGHGSLKGPLCQIGLGRSGAVYIVAAGIGSHAGKADDPDYTNSYAIGIEAEHPGTRGTPWPAAQYEAYAVLCAALQAHYGTPPVRGHKEIAVPKGRKTDPSFDMGAFRARVAGVGKGPAPVVSVAPGYELAAVQEAVASLGVDLGPAGIDGVDGPATKAAVMAAQTALGVHPDGVWGNKTQEAFMATLNEIMSKLEFVEKVSVETLDLARYAAEKAGKTNDAVGRMERETVVPVLAALVHGPDDGAGKDE